MIYEDPVAALKLECNMICGWYRGDSYDCSIFHELLRSSNHTSASQSMHRYENRLSQYRHRLGFMPLGRSTLMMDDCSPQSASGGAYIAYVLPTRNENLRNLVSIDLVSMAGSSLPSPKIWAFFLAHFAHSPSGQSSPEAAVPLQTPYLKPLGMHTLLP